MAYSDQIVWDEQLWVNSGRQTAALPDSRCHRMLAAGVSLLVLLLAVPVPAAADDSEGVPVEAASETQKREALTQYRAGVELMSAGKYDDALQQFRSSYGKVKSPNSRLMVARALAKLERLPEAYDELLEVIEDARELAVGLAKYEKTVQAAQAELADVTSRVALLRLSVDGRVTIGGEPVEHADWDRALAVMPGVAKVVYRLNDGRQIEEVVDLKAGKTTELLLEAPPPPTATQTPAPGPAPAPPERKAVSYETLGWTSAGVGAAGFATFAVFGLLNNARYGDLEEQCVDGLCPASAKQTAEKGRRYQTAANVGFGVGVVGAIAAVYFLVAAGEASGDDPALERRAGSRSDPGDPSSDTLFSQTQVRVGLGSLELWGQF